MDFSDHDPKTPNYTKKPNFSDFFAQSPVMSEIHEESLKRIEEGVPLTQVQQVVLREWLLQARVRVERLDLDADTGRLPPGGENELQMLRQEISRMEEFVQP